MSLDRTLVYVPDTCTHCGAPKAPRLLIAHIQATVASYYEIPVRHMTSQRRDWEYSHPRQVAMYLATELTPKPLLEIGRRFGGRDHSTVHYAAKAVQRRIATDAELAADVEALRERLAPVDSGDSANSPMRNSLPHAKEQDGNKQEDLMAA